MPASFGKAIAQGERLARKQHLEELPADGFEVICFPVKIDRASAGWTRAVAVLPI
jgi:hypothetical protein